MEKTISLTLIGDDLDLLEEAAENFPSVLEEVGREDEAAALDQLLTRLVAAWNRAPVNDT